MTSMFLISHNGILHSLNVTVGQMSLSSSRCKAQAKPLFCTATTSCSIDMNCEHHWCLPKISIWARTRWTINTRYCWQIEAWNKPHTKSSQWVVPFDTSIVQVKRHNWIGVIVWLNTLIRMSWLCHIILSFLTFKYVKRGSIQVSSGNVYIWFFDASMGGLLLHTAAPEYSPFCPWLSGIM